MLNMERYISMYQYRFKCTYLTVYLMFIFHKYIKCYILLLQTWKYTQFAHSALKIIIVARLEVLEGVLYCNERKSPYCNGRKGPFCNYTVKKGKCFCTLAGYCLIYDGWFPQQLEEYFYCHPQRFFASDRPGIHSINKEGIFPGI